MKRHWAASCRKCLPSGPKIVFLSLSLVAAVVGISLLVQGFNRTSSHPPSAESVADDSLFGRLLQSTVSIAPQGEPIRGCGVLVDGESRLIVTVPGVIGDHDTVYVWPANENGANHLSAEPMMDGKVAN